MSEVLWDKSAFEIAEYLFGGYGIDPKDDFLSESAVLLKGTGIIELLSSPKFLNQRHDVNALLVKKEKLLIFSLYPIGAEFSPKDMRTINKSFLCVNRELSNLDKLSGRVHPFTNKSIPRFSKTVIKMQVLMEQLEKEFINIPRICKRGGPNKDISLISQVEGFTDLVLTLFELGNQPGLKQSFPKVIPRYEFNIESLKTISQFQEFLIYYIGNFFHLSGFRKNLKAMTIKKAIKKNPDFDKRIETLSRKFRKKKLR